MAEENPSFAQAKGVPAAVPDAGLKNHDHYVRKLPEWRFKLREALLPFIRWETPYLARLQDSVRSPTLDSYFAMTANLGTHTFFMTALPILFWCGNTVMGRALVHMLALGVFWTGWVKDLVCLPRPLSPPLQRITMSGSAALEYGFPSTHSTNAVSVAIYVIYGIHAGETDMDPISRTMALVGCYWYAVSIIFGRLYCGMHGFSDVMIGSIMGALITALQLYCGPSFDTWIAEGDIGRLAIVVAIVILAVRFHPEPADNCPCFDDSVAFAGVILGVEVGYWSFSKSSFAWSVPSPATVPFDLTELGWILTFARILLGVAVIFAWRASMKPFLLSLLPPLFRSVEQLGLSLPRRFFTKASQYKEVPELRQDDNVIPSMKDIPAFLTSLRNPRRRAVSIGPQSEADAREMLAYREKIRRESKTSERPTFSRTSTMTLASPMEGFEDHTSHNGHTTQPRVDKPSQISENNTDIALLTPASSVSGRDEDVFLALEKPRVRYDVEVVTKLVVYAGIAWLAVEGNPLLFHLAGLGVRPEYTI